MRGDPAGESSRAWAHSKVRESSSLSYPLGLYVKGYPEQITVFGFSAKVGELSYRLATNRYVFYGSLILAASLIAGAVTRGHETLWRSAASLGIAAVVIGLLHAWLDARSASRNRCAHTKTRVKVR